MGVELKGNMVTKLYSSLDAALKSCFILKAIMGRDRSRNQKAL